jgi:hypothetical protein
MKRKNRNLTEQDTGREDGRNSTALTLTAPIVISLVSLGFGGYQYFDKRHLQRTNDELTSRAKALEIEQKKLEVRKEEIQHQPKLEIQYLESDMLSIYLQRELTSTRSIAFDRAFLKWISEIEKRMPYSVKLTLIRSAPYEEIIAAPEKVIETRISMFLIRNAGVETVSKISMNWTTTPGGRPYPINVDQLESNRGVIFVTGILNKKTHKDHGTRLVPDTELKYFDQFNNQQGDFIVRKPFSVPLIIDFGEAFHCCG